MRSSTREPKDVPIRWEKFLNLCDADDIFHESVMYLRRYPRSVEPFAAFVSASHACRSELMPRRSKPMLAPQGGLMQTPFARQ